MSIGPFEFLVVQGWSPSRFHRQSTLRFIPEECDIPRILIHLLSHILSREWSLIYCHDSDVRKCVSLAIKLLGHRRVFSSPMHDVKTTSVDFVIKRFSSLAHILLATPPTKLLNKPLKLCHSSTFNKTLLCLSEKKCVYNMFCFSPKQSRDCQSMFTITGDTILFCDGRNDVVYWM